MQKVRSWFYGSKTVSEKETDNAEKKIEADPPKMLATDKSDGSSDKISSDIDPKVAEYFKDFPEPYRRKAIERFSKRPGLYRWDYFRDQAMLEEVQSANRGIFLEDKREYAKEKDEEQKKRLIEHREEKQRQLDEREIPQWEKKLMTVIPLQKGETMGKKLFFTANFVLFGATFIWHGLHFRRSNPYPKWKVYSVMTGSIGIFCCCQIAAYYKLMDLGPFDKSKDDRMAIEKCVEEMREDMKALIKFLEDKGSKS